MKVSKPARAHQARRVRSYVRRGGRITDSQKRAYAKLWPEYGLSVATGLLDCSTAFQRCAPTIMEIGFGMGDSLAEMAMEAPDTNFIGVEVHAPGIGRLLNLIDTQQLQNVRLYRADAIEVLKKCIPDNSLNVVQLFFPDPWPKKRHHKRRIVQPEFTNLVKQKLVLGGTFHIATDWENYAEQINEVLSCTPGLGQAVALEAKQRHNRLRPRTKFERRGERLGHRVWDFVYCKNVE